MIHDCQRKSGPNPCEAATLAAETVDDGGLWSKLGQHETVASGVRVLRKCSAGKEAELRPFVQCVLHCPDQVARNLHQEGCMTANSVRKSAESDGTKFVLSFVQGEEVTRPDLEAFRHLDRDKKDRKPRRNFEKRSQGHQVICCQNHRP